MPRRRQRRFDIFSHCHADYASRRFRRLPLMLRLITPRQPAVFAAAIMPPLYFRVFAAEPFSAIDDYFSAFTFSPRR